MSENFETKPNANSTNPPDEISNQQDFPERASGAENSVPTEENFLDLHYHGDLSGISNSPLPTCSTPNELEKTFDEKYPSESRAVEKNCRYAFVEHTEQTVYSKTKPMDVLRQTQAHEVATESSTDSDIAEELKHMTLNPASRREHRLTKAEKTSATNFTHQRRRQISDERIFKFDEDLERERKAVAGNNENTAAENSVEALDQYERFRCINLKLFSNFGSRLRGLNELLMAAESLRKFMVHMRSQEDYKGDQLPERDIVRKSSLNALTSDKSNRFEFENLDRGMRIAWNKAIISVEKFLKRSRYMLQMYRQKSPEFCVLNIRYYLEYARSFQQELNFVRDLIQYRYDNLPRDRAIDTCLSNLCNLMNNFDKIFLVEYYLLQILAYKPESF